VRFPFLPAMRYHGQAHVITDGLMYRALAKLIGLNPTPRLQRRLPKQATIRPDTIYPQWKLPSLAPPAMAG
jgi:hypothetical protein